MNKKMVITGIIESVGGLAGIVGLIGTNIIYKNFRKEKCENNETYEYSWEDLKNETSNMAITTGLSIITSWFIIDTIKCFVNVKNK